MAIILRFELEVIKAAFDVHGRLSKAYLQNSVCSNVLATHHLGGFSVLFHNTRLRVMMLKTGSLERLRTTVKVHGDGDPGYRTSSRVCVWGRLAYPVCIDDSMHNKCAASGRTQTRPSVPHVFPLNSRSGVGNPRHACHHWHGAT